MRALICASLCAFATAAHANEVKYFEVGPWNKPFNITVYSSDGESWDTVDTNKTDIISLNSTLVCEWGGNNKPKYYEYKWDVEDLERTEGPFPSPFNGDKKIWAKYRYTPGDGFDARDVCNAEVVKRTSADASLTKYHVMSEDVTVMVDDAFKQKFSFYCKPVAIGFTDLQSKEFATDAKITCLGSGKAASKIPKDPPKPQTMTFVDLVQDVHFRAAPKHYVGKCPAQFTLGGSIKFGRPGTVKYRYVSKDGKVSPTFTVTANKAGNRPVRKWSTTLKQPEGVQGWANPEDKSGGANLKGHYTLEIVEPAGLPKVKAEYSATCTTEMQIQLQ